MILSPRILSGLRHFAVAIFNQAPVKTVSGPPAPTGDAKVDKVELRRGARPHTRYICPDCDTRHDDRYAAETCCPPEIDTVYVDAFGHEHYTPEQLAAAVRAGVPVEPPAWQVICPVCGIEGDTIQEAADCCLWLDLNPAARYRVASRVRAGAEWRQALEQEQ